jgi:hypothetical protein
MSLPDTLILVHIGSTTETMIDSLYQVLLFNDNIDVHILIDASQISVFKESLSKVNWNTFGLKIDKCHIYPVEDYLKPVILSEALRSFRGGFWMHTLNRFFAIEAFMKTHAIQKAFHIENDVVMYQSFNNISKCIGDDGIWGVRDAPNRVIPSVLFFTYKGLADCVAYMRLQLEIGFKNDMELLGSYPINKMPFEPFKGKIVVDGAAIGQYLGGIDCRNIIGGKPTTFQKLMYYYKTKGFINETCTFKADAYQYVRKKVVVNNNTLYTLVVRHPQTKKTVPLANVHAHNKLLYMFSSISSITYDNIISGDRVLGLCDFVIATPEIQAFHKGIDGFAKNLVLVNVFNKDTCKRLLDHLELYCKETSTTHLSLFVYTHILDGFMVLLDNFTPSFTITLYLHNSDHGLDTNTRLFDKPCIKHVFAQNLNVLSDKATLLPIGIANSMWTHGDISVLFRITVKRYLLKKQKALYVNINPSTFPYRRTVLDAIERAPHFEVSKGVPYEMYLKELSTYRFCLCMRGNGLDTHRFWECLYLGVIPVIINNKFTDSEAFVENLKRLSITFYEITSDSIDDIVTYNNLFFSEELYNSMVKTPLLNLDGIRLDTFSDFSFL